MMAPLFPLLQHLLPILVVTNALGVNAFCPALESRSSSEDTIRDVLSSPHARLEARYSAGPPDDGQCPRISKAAGGGTRSEDWWPCELSLNVLRQNSPLVNPFDEDFDYASEFAKLDGMC
jgi:catalase-peroxidase